MAEQDNAVDLNELCVQIVTQFREGNKTKALKDVSRAVEIAWKISEEWLKEPVRIFTVRHPIEFIMIANSDLPGADNCQMRSPNVAEAFYLAGSSLYEIASYEKSLRFFEESLVFNPVSARTWLEFSESYKRLQAWDRVVECARKALEYGWMMQEITHAHRVLSFAFSEQGDFEKAAAHIVLSLDYEPDSEPGLGELDWLVHQGYDVSQMTLDRAIEICGEKDDIACSTLVASSGFAILSSEDAPFQLREQAADMMESWVRGLRNQRALKKRVEM